MEILQIVLAGIFGLVALAALVFAVFAFCGKFVWDMMALVDNVPLEKRGLFNIKKLGRFLGILLLGAVALYGIVAADVFFGFFAEDISYWPPMYNLVLFFAPAWALNSPRFRNDPTLPVERFQKDINDYPEPSEKAVKRTGYAVIGVLLILPVVVLVVALLGLY